MIGVRREGWIKAEDVKIGDGFEKEGKVYLKLPNGMFLLIPFYQVCTYAPEICSIPGTAQGIELDVEIHFWRKKVVASGKKEEEEIK